ncbi:MAG: EsaB/YukD family protein [Lachnospiraceae bacterium]|nr:EsaB/YukD family protein [Lachnospiraceae bacterium]
MILVDVYVPAVNEQYDFKVDEDVPIAHVAEEIGEILTAGRAQRDEEMIGDLLLCDDSRKVILPMNETLKQNGIGNGSRLVLI